MGTVLITGANKGIGFACAKKFLSCGYNVIVSGRNEERLKNAVCRLDGRARYILWDISDTGCAYETVLKAEKLYGEIDTFVNNAGIVHAGQLGWSQKGFLHIDEKCFDETMAVNLKGTYFALQAQCRYMAEKGIKGHIVNLASEMSFSPSPDPYGISKWGVRAMTLGVAKEVAKYGITVNAVAPGETATEILRQKDGDVLSLECPRGRQAHPDEIAESIFFMANSENSIGSVLLSDGGRSLL